MANEQPPPVPDPTLITTEIINKEIKHLRELTESKLLCLQDETDKRFDLAERLRLEQKADTEKAVNAALAAAKEANTKTEATTKENLNQLGATFGNVTDELRRGQNDVKERVGKIESIKLGGNEARNAMYALSGFIVTLVVLAGFLAAAGVFQK